MFFVFVYIVLASVPVRPCDRCGHRFQCGFGRRWVFFLFRGFYWFSVVLLFFCGTALRVHPAVTRLTVHRRPYVKKLRNDTVRAMVPRKMIRRAVSVSSILIISNTGWGLIDTTPVGMPHVYLDILVYKHIIIPAAWQ